MRKITLLLCLFASMQNFAQWSQIGTDIDGEQAFDYSANINELAMSGDGRFVAVAASNNDTNGSNSGHVKVYQNIEGVWTQFGQTLKGLKINDSFGSGISIAKNGQVVAVGIPGDDATVNNSDRGRVKVYIYLSGSWIQLGNDVDGLNSDDSLGVDVALNANGSVLAISSSNVIKVYNFTGIEWLKVKDIDLDQLGLSSIELNDVGNVLVIGNRLYNPSGSGLTDSGRVLVYENVSGNWQQKGTSFLGAQSQGYFGSSVAVSGDGSLIAFGAPHNEVNGNAQAGFVRTYKYENNTWVQVGIDLKGLVRDINFGRSVSLNIDGSILAVGSDGRGLFGTGRGIAQVYQLKNNSWNQISSTIIGEDSKDAFGSSIVLSDDGATVAVGASDNDGGGSNAGHVRVFENAILLTTYLNKIEGLVLRIEKGEVVSNLKEITIKVFDLLGKEIVNDNISDGVYIVSATDQKGNQQVFKVATH